MKAGSSGGTHLMSETGVYEFPLLCTGSTLIIFTASAAFSGSINSVKATGQNSITSIPIQSIGTAIFKTNDVFKITTDDFVSPEFTITSDQSANDTSLSVASTNLDEDILINSDIVIDSKDLIAQYQNKTKGTVAGFTIDADGIAKGGVEITGWLDSDTMSGATANNVPTAESVKAYVDAQVGSADTLQEVTDNGNTTTNSVMIGSSSSPSVPLEVHGSNGIKVTTNSTALSAGYFAQLKSDYGTDALRLISKTGDVIKATNFGRDISFLTGDPTSENMRLTSGGDLAIGRTTASEKVDVQGNIILRGTNNLTIGSTSSGGDFSLSSGIRGYKFANNNGDLLTISSDGNVLIGTTTDDGSSKLQVNGDIKINDNNNYIAGTGADFKIHHDGVNSYIRNFSGDLYIRNTVDDKDIIFESDDGSGEQQLI